MVLAPKLKLASYTAISAYAARGIQDSRSLIVWEFVRYQNVEGIVRNTDGAEDVVVEPSKRLPLRENGHGPQFPSLTCDI